MIVWQILYCLFPRPGGHKLVRSLIQNGLAEKLGKENAISWRWPFCPGHRI